MKSKYLFSILALLLCACAILLVACHHNDATPTVSSNTSDTADTNSFDGENSSVDTSATDNSDPIAEPITVTVTRDLNGGTLSNFTTSLTVGASYDLGTPERSGYTFGGWYYGETAIPTTGTWTIEETVTLTAAWTANAYVCTLIVGDGAQAEQTALTITFNTSYTLPIPTKTGYDFVGWYDGETPVATSGVWSISSDITLTAHWAENAYTATYHANGGEIGVPSKKVAYNASYTLDVPTRTGYEFAGWFHGDVPIPTTGCWTISNDVTLTAAWTPKIYTVTYQPGEGAIQTSSTTVTYGTEYTLETPTREGYQFDGWLSGTAPIPMTGTWTIAGNVTLTAVWKIKSHTVTVNASDNSCGSVSGGGQYATDTSVTLTAVNKTSLPTDFVFLGWYDTTGTRVNTDMSYTFAVNTDITLTATWGIDPALESFNYAKLDNGVAILGVKDKSKTEYVISSRTVRIDRGAFQDCDALKTIRITDLSAWCHIRFEDEKANPLYYAEEFCLNDLLITDLTIPDGVSYIGSFAFFGYDHLTSVTIPDGVTSIGERAFFACSHLKKLELPYNLAAIGASAFYNCQSLTVLNLPSGVTAIGDHAFAFCSNLVSITIPATVTSLGAEVFTMCNKLVEAVNHSTFVVPAIFEVHNGTSKVVAANDYLFFTHESTNYLIGYVGDDTELTLPEAYCGERYTIYDYAFLNNDRITSVTIPSNVTDIGSCAFEFCKKLKTVTIGSDVIHIGSMAFGSCIALEGVTFLTPSGWLAGGISVIASDLSNTSTAASYLRDTYCLESWSRG